MAKILIVDDEPRIRELIRENLQYSGYTCEEAGGPLGTHIRAGPFIGFGIKERRGWSSAAPKPHANSFKESKLV